MKMAVLPGTAFFHEYNLYYFYQFLWDIYKQYYTLAIVYRGK